MLATRKSLPSGHRVVTGGAHQVPYEVKLMGVALAGKDRLANQHLAKNAAAVVVSTSGPLQIRGPRLDLPNAPYIDGRGILSELEQKLGRTVPASDDEPGIVASPFAHGPPSLRHGAVVVSGQAKIGNLQDALVVDEKVGSLHVSVQDVVVVEIAEALEQLLHVALDLGLLEVHRRVIEKTRQVMVHVGRHHVHDGLLALVGYARTAE